MSAVRTSAAFARQLTAAMAECSSEVPNVLFTIFTLQIFTK